MILPALLLLAAPLLAQDILSAAQSRLAELKFAPSAPYAAANARRRPASATIQGGLVDLSIDRRNWTVTGGANGPVSVRIDHSAGTITGGGGRGPVKLRFSYADERYLVESDGRDGGANGAPVRLDFDWKAGRITGHAGNAGVDLTVDLGRGTVSGGAGGAPVKLAYDASSGRVSGGMNGRPFEVVLTNLTFGEFLTYLWLLIE